MTKPGGAGGVSAPSIKLISLDAVRSVVPASLSTAGLYAEIASKAVLNREREANAANWS
jgi:hypothetical protein